MAPFRSPSFRLDRYWPALNDDPGAAAGGSDPDEFLVAERPDIPSAPGFPARYQELGRFEPAAFPLAAVAQIVYPFAGPPIRSTTCRAPDG